MRTLLGWMLACTPEAEPRPEASPAVPWPDPTCEGWFGAPLPETGLSETFCRPEVQGASTTWRPAALSPEDLAALRAWPLRTPFTPLETDPYQEPAPAPAPPDEVCAVHAEGEGYDLRTWPDPDAAAAAAGWVTHGGACGACSTLEDLAVYAEQPDLTAPVRACGLAAFGDLPTLEGCLAELGFTAACTRIWAYNVLHTQQVCGATCLALLEAPYHEEDGALNACLQCDEDLSGPVFKARAGRTRRNTGLPNALCRPCTEVWRVEHQATAQAAREGS